MTNLFKKETARMKNTLHFGMAEGQEQAVFAEEYRGNQFLGHMPQCEEIGAVNRLSYYPWDRAAQNNTERPLQRILSAFKQLFNRQPQRFLSKERQADNHFSSEPEEPQNHPRGEPDSFYEFVFNTQGIYSYIYYYDKAELHINHRMQAFFGLQSPIIKNTDEILKYIHKDDLEKAMLFCSQPHKTPQEKIELRIVVPGQNVLWFALCETSTYNEGGVELFKVGTLTDISEQIYAQFKNKTIIDGSFFCQYFFDFKKNTADISPRILEICPLRDMHSVSALDSWLSLAVPEDRQMLDDSLKAVFAGEVNEHSLEYRVVGYDGEPIWVACRGRCTYDENGQPAYFAGSIIDIRTLGQYNKYLTLLSSIDSLTGLPNRLQLNADFEKILPRVLTNGCVLLIDVDDFKNINTLFGIHAGDKFVQYFARFLSKKKSKTMRLYHFKIDRFFILFEETVTSEINAFIEGIKEFTNEGILIDGKLIKATFSIGGAVFYQGQTVTEVIDNAEIAIRKIKTTGKNGFEMFSQADKESYIKKIALESILLKAVEHNMDGFMPYFQPIYSVKEDKIIGAEALIRWRDQSGLVQPPMLIIPRLQALGIFHRVERWIMNEAAHFCRKWIDMGMADDFMVNINLTPEQAARDNAKDEILKILALNDLTERNIVVEITEETLVPGIKPGSEVLRELKNAGIRLAIDDFGTGYSSLSYLREMPVYEIKIDRSFIKDIEQADSAKNIVSAIISLSKSMEYIVCVEGVETAGQLQILREIGADLLQGFYFSQPLPAHMFEEKYIKK